MSQGQGVDTRYLEGLLGYNARRAALVIIDHFVRDALVGPRMIRTRPRPQ